jgi:hypothetical protein
MAELAGLQAPRYGDDQSADVLLHVRPSEGAPSAPLLLHSRVLRKSEFFEARLSERWASRSASSPESDRCFKPLEITLDTCADAETYIRCIRLLYAANPVKDTTFNDVQDAVGILQVAAEILFHDCVGACMRYLEAVRWSAEDESAIRSRVASLQLQVSPELAFRLCSLASLPDNCSPADLMGDVLDELLTQARNTGHARALDLTTSVLLANAQATSSPAFAAVNEIALHKELQTNWDRLKMQLKTTNLVYVYRDQVN